MKFIKREVMDFIWMKLGLYYFQNYETYLDLHWELNGFISFNIIQLIHQN